MSKPLTIRDVLNEVRKTHEVACVTVAVWDGEMTSPKPEVRIWDGVKQHYGPTLEAAYQVYLANQYDDGTPAETTAEQALDLTADTPRE